MTLVKFNNRNRLFPWNIAGLPSLSTDEFFNDDFFCRRQFNACHEYQRQKERF